MLGPYLLGCAGCALRSPVITVLAFYLGGVGVLFCLLQPFSTRVKQRWGVPHFHITDFISLLMLVMWPVMLGRIGMAHHSVARVLICTMLLITCAFYLWLRGLWILEQLGVNTFARRTCFLGMLLPAMLLDGLIIAYGIVSAFVNLIGMRTPLEGLLLAVSQVATVSVLFGVPGTIALILALRYVMGDRAIPPKPANRLA